MKEFYLIFFFIFTSLGFSQIPANYYDSADGLSGYGLKTELKNIISAGHSDQGYDALYTAYITTYSDNYYENDGSVLDFYSENPNGTDSYFYTHGVAQCGNYDSENDCYNREHLVPQSSFNEAQPMRSDVHHVIPTDGYVNNRRSSYPFGIVGSATWTSLNGSKVGTSDVSGYSGTMFEPIDEFKGDIARALLYFATRYETTVDDYTSFDMFNGTEDQVFQIWAIEMLLDWHYNVDPVDQSEIDRNNASYNYQGNANPFVDHPEYANLIWNPSPDTQAPDAITDLSASNPTDNTIDLNWSEPFDNVGVISYDIYVDGSNTYNTANTNFTVTGLTSETNYCFTVYAKDAAGNSTVSNQDCETTLASGGGTVELFFSEYVEGGGFNKALEIANFTGTSVNLSSYTLKLATNANNFSYTYTFPTGLIANGDVFVLANSGLLTACQPQQDDVNTNITGFNGNDAIGLFKNNVLIDIIGIEGDGGTFAENVTLIRKPTVEFPSTTFDSNEWTVVAQDDCSDLGTHQQTLGVKTNQIPQISFYPNPVKGNKLKINTIESLQVEIFNILGKRLLSDRADSDKQNIDISSLKKGIYLIKLSTQYETQTRKLIRQ